MFKMLSRLILVAVVFATVLWTTNSESCTMESLATTCPIPNMSDAPTTDEEIQKLCGIFTTYFACVNSEISTCSQSFKESVQTQLLDQFQPTYDETCGGMAINPLNIGVYIIIALAKFTYDRFM